MSACAAGPRRGCRMVLSARVRGCVLKSRNPSPAWAHCGSAVRVRVVYGRVAPRRDVAHRPAMQGTLKGFARAESPTDIALVERARRAAVGLLRRAADALEDMPHQRVTEVLPRLAGVLSGVEIGLLSDQ